MLKASSMVDDQIEAFLAGNPHAVVGASRDRDKYGNKVLRSYQQAGLRVFAVNPRFGDGDEIEGAEARGRLADLPEAVHGISIITPPAVTERIVEEAVALGIAHIWMQPGAESPVAIERAEAAGISVIAGGACVLVRLGFPRG